MNAVQIAKLILEKAKQASQGKWKVVVSTTPAALKEKSFAELELVDEGGNVVLGESLYSTEPHVAQQERNFEFIASVQPKHAEIVAKELLEARDIFLSIIAGPDVIADFRRVQEWLQRNAKEESNG